jgi:predicted nuclease of predicted toxin-antitoxin system
MRIKLDENLSRYLKEDLAALGHNADTAAEENLLGRSDIEVGAAANVQSMMVFSLDLDFADLRKFAPGTHAGVIVFRPHSMGPKSVNAFVRNFVENTRLEELQGAVVIVEPGRIRVRRAGL